MSEHPFGGDRGPHVSENGGTHTGRFNVGDGGSLIIGGNRTHSFSSSANIVGSGGSASLHGVLFDAATTNFGGSIGTLLDVRVGEAKPRESGGAREFAWSWDGESGFALNFQ